MYENNRKGFEKFERIQEENTEKQKKLEQLMMEYNELQVTFDKYEEGWK